MKKKYLIWLLLIPLAQLYLKNCTIHYEKLGESTIFESKNIHLKVVTRHEHLPLHYIGDAYSLICQSDNTINFPERKSEFIPKGWTAIPAPTLACSIENGIKCDHKTLAEEAKKSVSVFDNSTVVVITHNGLSISFDNCKTFAKWDLSNIPRDNHINRTAEFEKCQERQNDVTNGDACWDLNFIEENKPKYSDIQVIAPGNITFSFESEALKKQKKLKFTSTDFGKTWTCSCD